MYWLFVSATVVLTITVTFLLWSNRGKNNKKVSKESQEAIKRMNEGLTYQTLLQFNISKSKIEEAIDNDMPVVPHSFNMNITTDPYDFPKQLAKLQIPADQFYGVNFPIHDEDKANKPWYQNLINYLLNAPPVKDIRREFDEQLDEKALAQWEEAVVQKIYDTFEHTFVGLEKYDITSDHGVSLMAFSGIGCHYVKKVKTGDLQSDAVLVEHGETALKNAKFMVDLRVLGQFAVRAGFVKYGCCVYFNGDYEVLGIYVCEYDRLFTPMNTSNGDDGDEEQQQQHRAWEHAKWVYRVTAVTAITIEAHLLYTHEIEAQALVTSTREYLPFTHPLRRLLKPFCFRTVYINHSAAKNLIGRKQLVHRAWAYDYEQVNEIMNALQQSYKFELLENKFTEMSDVPDDVFPIATDMREYWQITRKFVDEYLSVYFRDDDELAHDKYVQSWYQQMLNALLVPTESEYRHDTKQNLVLVLTHLICNSTAWHQYAGNAIQEYLRRPNWGGSKIRDGESTQADIQAYIQAITIGILTGLPMPDLVNDWKFVLLEDEHQKETQRIFDEWQSELKEMSKRVNERNLHRRMPIVFVDPARLDCSVGI
eukprot:CAMPEP_0197047194 /NCGR_PEP_ID=MMETSP1384-20130603/22725_1 /TAXON_ID=29189 /ORGANISM="Ammonia sp." /LENGTH=593 /DNA_ID=CAMNT_0042479075 /DNA_START=92 /DNA_END=1873 /DNA_ORIENTATION=+